MPHLDYGKNSKVFLHLNVSFTRVCNNSRQNFQATTNMVINRLFPEHFFTLFFSTSRAVSYLQPLFRYLYVITSG